jgi:hypothetical protein
MIKKIAEIAGFSRLSAIFDQLNESIFLNSDDKWTFIAISIFSLQ